MHRFHAHGICWRLAMWQPHNLRNRRGQAVVEFAFVAPVFLLERVHKLRPWALTFEKEEHRR